MLGLQEGDELEVGRMTYDPRNPFRLPNDQDRPLTPLHYEYERPSQRVKPPYLAALAVVCMGMGLVGIGVLAWVVSKW